MLLQLRSHASGFFAKILLAFLVLTFAAWGVGDMLRHPGHLQVVATVGDKTVTVQQFQTGLKTMTDALRQAYGGNLTPQMAKQMRLQERVLHSLINEQLLTNEAQAMGLVPSDADVARHVRSDPAMLDGSGNFDKARFEAMLKGRGLSEKNYVEQVRHEIAIGLLKDTLMGSVAVPPAEVDMLYQAREEQRSATVYMIGAGAAPAPASPDADELQSFYGQHVHDFSAPEYRSLSYVTFKNSDATAKAAVTEAELQAAYRERADEFRKPERRFVDQLLYASEGEAQKAYDALQQGAKLEQLAKTTGILNKNAVSLGAVERGRIVPGAEDAVFALGVGGVSAPVQSPFGWHVFRVNKIEPPSVSPFAEARGALEKELAQQKAENALSQLANKLEDALAGGSTLQEAARELGLPVKSLGPIDRLGRSPAGSAAGDIPALDNFMEVAFKAGENSESPVTTSKDGVYYIVRVDKLTPERTRALDEVKGAVVAAWQKEHQAKALGELAQTIAGKLAKKESREAAVAQYKLKATSIGPVKRTAQKSGDTALSPLMMIELFTRKPGEATGAYPMGKGEYGVAVVKDVIPAPLPDKKAKDNAALAGIHDDVLIDMQNEMFTEYVTHLAEKYPVSINRSLLEPLDSPDDHDLQE